MINLNLEENLKIKLQQQAKNNGHSLEEEIIAILQHHLIEEKELSLNLAERIKQRFSSLENVEITEIPRNKMRIPPDFD